jgi:hypothetical protein
MKVLAIGMLVYSFALMGLMAIRQAIKTSEFMQRNHYSMQYYINSVKEWP